MYFNPEPGNYDRDLVFSKYYRVYFYGLLCLLGGLMSYKNARPPARMISDVLELIVLQQQNVYMRNFEPYT